MVRAKAVRRRRPWSQLITKPTIEIFVLYVGGVPAGFFELDAAEPRETKLCYFGLVPDFIGRGFGAYMLQAAIDRAWTARPIDRLWLHTSTYDHPNALRVYQRAGFCRLCPPPGVVRGPAPARHPAAHPAPPPVAAARLAQTSERPGCRRYPPRASAGSKCAISAPTAPDRAAAGVVSTCRVRVGNANSTPSSLARSMIFNRISSRSLSSAA